MGIERRLDEGNNIGNQNLVINTDLWKLVKMGTDEDKGKHGKAS